MNNGIYVHYGCGLCAPMEWENYDSSPTLRIQKAPLIGSLLKNKLNVTFPDNVLYGDIIKGLPVPGNSCNGIYCSHTLEHLSLTDFRSALKNTCNLLKPGGIFRCVLPDLETAAKNYIEDLKNGKPDASINFMHSTLLGMETRPKGMKGIAATVFGNSNHLWMWDRESLKAELIHAGFKNVRECTYNDCEDKMFQYVEDKNRFVDAVAMEAKK
jgi:ubiquinone/menaquinone biosynthesis C-methylase UbiE